MKWFLLTFVALVFLCVFASASPAADPPANNVQRTWSESELKLLIARQAADCQPQLVANAACGSAACASDSASASVCGQGGFGRRGHRLFSGRLFGRLFGRRGCG